MSPKARSPRFPPSGRCSHPLAWAQEQDFTRGRGSQLQKQATQAGQGPRCAVLPGAQRTGWGRRRVDGVQAFGQQWPSAWRGHKGDAASGGPSCSTAGVHGPQGTPECSDPVRGPFVPWSPSQVLSLLSATPTPVMPLWVWPGGLRPHQVSVCELLVSTRHEPSRSTTSLIC